MCNDGFCLGNSLKLYFFVQLRLFFTLGLLRPDILRLIRGLANFGKVHALGWNLIPAAVTAALISPARAA